MGTRRNGDKNRKSMVPSIYGALMLLNFCGNRGFKLKKTFGKQSFRYLSKIKLSQKNFPKNHPRLQIIQKND